MSSESGEIISSKARAITEPTTKPTEPEQLPCPRCDSTNTKFCYYNNYNLSQPRHFCKSCRRYWTRGGALRNVPIGGGTRRSSSSNKRPRTSSPSSSSSVTVANNQEVLNSVPVSEMGNGSVSSSHFMGHCYDMNLNEALPEPGSFSSLLNNNANLSINSGNVFFGVPSHRYVGVGSGLYGMGFGLNMFDFPVEQRDGGGGAVVSGGGGGGVQGGGATWQLEGGLINDGNDNFSWPDLAISTQGKSSLK